MWRRCLLKMLREIQFRLEIERERERVGGVEAGRQFSFVPRTDIELGHFLGLFACHIQVPIHFC